MNARRALVWHRRHCKWLEGSRKPPRLTAVFFRNSPETVDVVSAGGPANSQTASAIVRGHLLLSVAHRGLQSFYVVPFGLADDLLDGAGHGRFDFLGRRVRVGDDQACAADGYGFRRLRLDFAGGSVVQQLPPAAPSAAPMAVAASSGGANSPTANPTAPSPAAPSRTI
jgi:hypothetical protein